MARCIACFFIWLSFLSPAKLVAENILNGHAIKLAIQHSLSMHNVSATPLINEKKIFPKCDKDLSINPNHKSWKTVVVECEGQSPWKIIVRNKFDTLSKKQAHNKPAIKKTTPAPILLNQVQVGAIKRSIRRGDVILPTDVIAIKIPLSKATDVFPNSEDLIGRRAKTTIKALTPVFSRQLDTDFMIEKNMQVTIIHQGTSISVQMEGIALEDGQYGDWIKVENSKTGRQILAKVVDEKKVNI
ncbi:MAG: flagellar basal body P-ring formation protein FlgA [Alphaproteobacteria bacterium]|nr:flagellar basal body P-ring formation protein FlgA [Alphaproteobacteria bacterium]